MTNNLGDYLLSHPVDYMHLYHDTCFIVADIKLTFLSFTVLL